jgi:O-antigen ligase
MRKLTWYLLWVFVFSVPWGVGGSIPGIGTITRVLGMVMLVTGALTTIAEGRIRKPGAIFWVALLYAFVSSLSLVWTISFGDTVERAGTLIQFVGLIWVVGEFARSRDEQYSLMLAFCLGSSVFAFDLLRNFSAGVRIHADESRYSASGINANYVAFTLVTGFPMAWLIFRQNAGLVRIMAAIYCLVAPVAMLLTGGRGSFVAGCVAVSIVPLSLRRDSWRSLLPVMVVLGLAAVAIGFTVPQRTWDRLLTIKQEVEGGTMSGRTQIWDAGWRTFDQRPLLGWGAGVFPVAVEPLLYRPRAAHNVALALLVEQGVIGLAVFASLLLVCAWTIAGLPSTDRQLWTVLLLAWLISAMSGDSHNDKVTWILFGLLAAQGAIKKARQHLPVLNPGRVSAGAGEPLLVR